MMLWLAAFSEGSKSQETAGGKMNPEHDGVLQEKSHVSEGDIS